MKQTQQRKEWFKKYRQTDKYKNRVKAYRKKWLKTKKGKESTKRHFDKIKAIIDLHRDKCVECGETNKTLLQFHHIDPLAKIKDVHGFASINKTLIEIAKCEVLCENCHYKKHNKKARVKCPCCGTTVAYDSIVSV